MKRNARGEGTNNKAWFTLTGRDFNTKTHTYLQRASMKDPDKARLEVIKQIASKYEDVPFVWTFQEETRFQKGVLIVNPEDDIKDIERAFKGRSKTSEPGS